jgi:hypothetical protein
VASLKCEGVLKIVLKKSPLSSDRNDNNPEIENSLYSTIPFLKIKGYFPPKASNLLSKTVDLKLPIFGLNLIFNCFSPSYKKQSSKSHKTGPSIFSILLEYSPALLYA